MKPGSRNTLTWIAVGALAGAVVGVVRLLLDSNAGEQSMGSLAGYVAGWTVGCGIMSGMLLFVTRKFRK
jgi:hypothetical protein